MTFRPTILNLSTVIFLTGILVFTIWNYHTLSANGGWGVVGMVGLAGIGVVAGITDLILQRMIRSQKVVNFLGLLIVVGLTIALLIG